MADIFNEHFREFIQALNEQDVEYILVGGMAAKKASGRFRDLDDIEQLTKK